MLDTLDITLAPLAVVLCVGIYFFLLFRHPAGTTFFGVTVLGLGGTPIYSTYSYVILNTLLHFVGIGFLGFRLLQGDGLARLAGMFTSRRSHLLLLLLFVWGKIGMELLFDGIGYYQLVALKTGIYSGLGPAILFALAAAQAPMEKVVRDLVLGSILFALAHLLPTVPGILLEGRILDALFAGGRLITYGQDTINSCRFFFIGALGAVGGLCVPRIRPVWLPILWTLFAAFLVGMLLNATRQFIVGVLLAGLLLFPTLRRQKGYRVIIAIAGFGLAGAFVLQAIQSEELAARVAYDEIAAQLVTERGSIWRQAWEDGMQNPMRGTGFRHFGDIQNFVNAEGEVEEMLDTAHGVFPDIFAEHGAVLGVLVSASFLVLAVRLLVELGRQREDSGEFAMLVMAVAMVVPLLLSGTVVNSLGLYIFAITAGLLPQGPKPSMSSAPAAPVFAGEPAR